MKHKILIVGGTGFLGYHLAKKCLLKGWIVHSISTSKPKKIRFLKKVKYIILDITNKKLFKKKLNFDYDYVVNLGGYVNHSEKKKTHESHYIGCKNLVDFYLKKKIKSFIQIGSCVEYGFIASPQKEISNININTIKSTYGRAKLLSTNYLLKKFDKYKFPCTILRLYLVFGPHQDFNRFIPLITKGCLENSKFPTSDGLQLRSFLYVDDFSNAIFKCIKNKKANGQIFNIGSDKSIKLKKVINSIKSIVKGGQPNWGKIKLRKDEILNLYPDIQKIKKILNWKPKVNFEKGLKRTVNYYKKTL